MNEHYVIVGKAMSEAQAITEAFCAILRLDLRVARRALASAQRDHYGLKPYLPGCPPDDAEGNEIVYRDESGWRFTVKNLLPSGAHIRIMLGGGRRFYEAWSKDVNEAQKLGRDFGAKEPQLGAAYTSSVKVGDFIVLRYEYRRASLD